MRSAWWLALVGAASAYTSLDRPRQGFLEDVLDSRQADQKSCKPTGLIEDACCDFETVESVNSELYQGLHKLVQSPYFRYHKVDLYRDCPFWKEDGSCMNRACGVETTDEDHIPVAWRSSTLGELDTTNATSTPDRPSGCDVDDTDFCVLDDEADSDGIYVDLIQNPERFTGYAGHSSARVWKAIYEENCFTPQPFVDPTRGSPDGGDPFASLNAFGGLRTGTWGESERSLMNSLAAPRDEEEVCLEKRVFYRLISGLHASISIHICDDYLDQETGQWAPNLECFVTRIAQHPERLQNVYFAYVLSLRALSKSGPLLLDALERTSVDGKPEQKQLSSLVQTASGCPSTFDETSMFSGPEATLLKQEFKEHFRNVSRIMDCVGCDKCRLWGKLQVTGLGTALKLLFSADDQESLQLSRGEVVAFVNTLHRLSESLAAVENFRTMWASLRPPSDKKQKRKGAGTALPLPASTARRPVAPSSPVNRTSAPQTQAGLVQKLITLCRDGWGRCFDLLVGGARLRKTEL